MSEWQPIETAPKDGMAVDLWCVDSDGSAYRVTDCYWIGPVESNEHGIGFWHDIDPLTRVTHWMPPPDPPEESQE